MRRIGGAGLPRRTDTFGARPGKQRRKPLAPQKYCSAMPVSSTCSSVANARTGRCGRFFNAVDHGPQDEKRKWGKRIWPEPGAAPDRAGRTTFRDIKARQPARQGSFLVRRPRGRRFVGMRSLPILLLGAMLLAPVAQVR